MSLTNSSNYVQNYVFIYDDYILNTDLSEFHCKKEFFKATDKLEINSRINEVNGSAFWTAPQIELHGSTNSINGSVYLSADKVVFDHATIRADHIYVLNNAEIVNDSSSFSCPFEYLTVDELGTILNSYIS